MLDTETQYHLHSLFLVLRIHLWTFTCASVLLNTLGVLPTPPNEKGFENENIYFCNVKVVLNKIESRPMDSYFATVAQNLLGPRALCLFLYAVFIDFCLLLVVEFTKLNPIGYVPVLVDEGIVVSDSLAILMVSGWDIYPLHLMFVGLHRL